VVWQRPVGELLIEVTDVIAEG
ncbi:transcription elongation factor GreAB, partial [Pseudomonas sp. CAH-1]|nr:transcription elongation factor GreAB [Pseudomonas sp. CAH-1]